MTFTGSRAVLRIGWRNIGGNKWRSLLIVLLVILPVAAMAGGMTVMVTATPTPEDRAASQMGMADATVYPQALTSTTDVLRSLLPDGSRVEPFQSDIDRLHLPGRELAIGRLSVNLDGLGRGMLTLLDGRLPADATEVAISRALANAAGLAVGQRIDLLSIGQATIVGLVENPMDLSARVVLEHYSTAAPAGQGEGSLGWLVGLPAGADQSVLDPLMIDGISPAQLAAFSVTPRWQVVGISGDSSLALLVIGALVMVESALIAATAFAVGVRRRQRELGVLAASGAVRRQLAGTVLAEGLLLGFVGSVIGTLIGVGCVFAISPWLDELVNRRLPGVVIPIGGIIAACAIGILAILLAAAVPAWSAARLPVLAALSGRRPPSTPARRALLFGVVLVVGAIGATSTGATMRLTGSDPSGTASSLLLVLGAIAGVLGFGAASPWFIERAEWISRRLPLSSRIALRDTARARSRNAPIVTAVLASLAATVAFACLMASLDAQNLRNWRPYMLPDQMLIQGEGALQAGPEAAQALGAVAQAAVQPVVVAADPDSWVLGEDPAAPLESLDRTYEFIAIGGAGTLDALGAGAAAPALARDEAVLLVIDPIASPSLKLSFLKGAGPYRDPTVVKEVTLPATAVVMGFEAAAGGLPHAVISDRVAKELGLGPSENGAYLIRLGRPVTEADVAIAAGPAARYANTTAWAGALKPGPAYEGMRILLIALSLMVAMSITAVAVALGEAEARADQRTLLAVGADPAIRRRITAARAGVLALLAGLLAVPAGLLPAWGLIGSRVNAPFVVPWPEILLAVAALPLAGIIGGLLLTRPIPSWSAFREAAA